MGFVTGHGTLQPSSVRCDVAGRSDREVVATFPWSDPRTSKLRMVAEGLDPEGDLEELLEIV